MASQPDLLRCYLFAVAELPCIGVGGTEHSPGVSLNTTFQLTGQSLLDDCESSSADEEEVIRAQPTLTFCNVIFLSNILVL